eukprot:3303955-Rhodomonas_salina.4
MEVYHDRVGVAVDHRRVRRNAPVPHGKRVLDLLLGLGDEPPPDGRDCRGERDAREVAVGGAAEAVERVGRDLERQLPPVQDPLHLLA